MRISARGLSNVAGATAKIEASLRAVPGGELKQSGTLRLTPFAATGKIEIEGVEPGRFAPYTHDAIAFDVARGQLRLGTGYDVAEEHAQTTVRLRDAFVELSDLALKRRGVREPFFRMGLLAVRGADIDVAKQRVRVTEVVTRDANARLMRDAKGVLDLTTLVPSAPEPAAGAQRASKPPPAAAAPSAPAWIVEVERVGIESGRAGSDCVVTPTAVVNVTPITVRATNVSTAPGARMGLDVRLGVNKKGRLQITGSAAIDPFAANLKVDLKTLEILPLQSYFRDQIGNLTVTDGTVSLKAQAAVKTVGGGDPRIGITADIDVADLATVDDAKKDPLIAWKALHVGGLKVSTAPMAIAIGQVALADFESHLVVGPDGRFNLEEAFSPRAAPVKTPPKGSSTPAPRPAASSKAAPPGPTITVGELALRGGIVRFDDRSLRPSYSAELTDLTGTISGLSSTPGPRPTSTFVPPSTRPAA